MAIPKLLKTMRESLSGKDWNEDKHLQITENNCENGVEILAGSARLFRGNENYGFTFDAQEYTSDNGDDILTLTGINSENVVIQNIGTPVDPYDAVNKEYVDNNGGTFTATYGTTTYAEIVEAFNQGKAIYCRSSDESIIPLYQLATRPTKDNNVLKFYNMVNTGENNTYATTYCQYYQINVNNAWNTGTVTGEQVYGSIYKNSNTPITSSTGYYRPIRISNSEPTSSTGYTGDIWIQYES